MAPRSGETSDQARQASRARILDAARALFAERGFAACRVADVARRAGMSPGNVYWHFDAKEAILRAILAEGFGNLEAMTAAVAEEYGPARRKLDILVDRTLELYERNGAFTVILGGLMGEGGRDLLRGLGFDPDEIGGRAHANLRRVFSEARAEAVVVTSADPDLLVAFYLAFFNGLRISYGSLWPTVPRDVLRDTALRLVGYRPAG
jgi:AcrR family transcriptional regulator